MLLLLALACAPEPPPAAAPADGLAVAQAMALADPDLALGLLGGLTDQLRTTGCEPAAFSDGEGLREVWSACPEGADAGEVERYDDGASGWLEATGLRLVEGVGRPVLRLDGAAEHALEEDEVTGQVRLGRLDLNAALCSDDLCGPEWDEETDLLHVDLSWTLVPDDDPQRRDVLLTGTLVTPELGPTLVEGAWTVDPALCEVEPMGGKLLLRADQGHAVLFNGADACDGCGEWLVDGERIGAVCVEPGV